MDKVHEGLLVVLQHIQHVFFLVQVGLKMVQDLTGEVIEQFCMIIVMNVVKVDESADEVIFRPVFRNNATSADQMVSLMITKVLNKNVLAHRLKVKPAHVNSELLESTGHLPNLSLIHISEPTRPY